jgi:hypothetical protein
MSDGAWAALVEASVVYGLLLGWGALGWARRRADRVERERYEAALDATRQREGGIQIDLRPGDDVIVFDNCVSGNPDHRA